MDQEAILAMLHDLSTRIDEAPRKVKPDQTVSVTNRTSSKQSEVLSPYWSCMTIDPNATAPPFDLTSGASEDWDQMMTDFTGAKLEYSISTGDGFLLLPNYEVEHVRAEIVFTNSGPPFSTSVKVQGDSGGASSYVQFKVNSTVSEYGGSTGLDQDATITILTGRNRIAFTISATGAATYLNGCIKGKLLIPGKTTWVKDNK